MNTYGGNGRLFFLFWVGGPLVIALFKRMGGTPKVEREGGTHAFSPFASRIRFSLIASGKRGGVTLGDFFFFGGGVLTVIGREKGA